MKLPVYAKAIAGAVLAILTTLGTAAVDNGVTTAEWCGVGVAGLTAFLGVYAVPNGARRVRRRKNV